MQSIPGGSGLVYSVTSVTAGASPPSFITVDPVKKRLSRMRKSVITSARLHCEDLQKGGFRFQALMLTTTYAPESEWGARDVTGLVRCIREWCRRRSIEFRYHWVLELTKAGRPHYHLLMFVPRGVMLPKPDKRGWWRLGFTRIERARNAVGYLAKYASKGATALAMPAGARLHGGGGLEPQSRAERSWWMLPQWVRSQVKPEDRTTKVTGGFLARASGEFFASPWQIVGRCPEWSWVRLAAISPLPNGVPLNGATA